MSTAFKRCKQQLTLRGGDMQPALCACHLPMEWKLPIPCKVPDQSLLSNVGFSGGSRCTMWNHTVCGERAEGGGITLKSEMGICRGPEAECWPDTWGDASREKGFLIRNQKLHRLVSSSLFKKRNHRAGEEPQQLKTLTTLPVGLGLIPQHSHGGL